MQSDNEDIEQELADVVADRLKIMQDPSYEYPKRISRADWVAIILIIVVCLCLVVYGAFCA